MTRNRILGLFVGVSLMCVMPMRAQESRPASDRTDAQQEPKPIIPQVPKVNVAQPRQPK